MPEFALFVTYSDVFGKPITDDELIARIEMLSLNDCLQSVGKLSHLIAVNDLDSGREALGWALRGLRVPGAVMALDGMVRHGGRVLLWNKQLMALARLALLHAEDRPPAGANVPVRVMRQPPDRWRALVQPLSSGADPTVMSEDEPLEIVWVPKLRFRLQPCRFRRMFTILCTPHGSTVTATPREVRFGWGSGDKAAVVGET